MSAFSCAFLEASKLIIAVIPCGTVFVGITISFLPSTSSAACSAARIMFLLFGRTKTVSALMRSAAFKISSVLGFMVCPPSITSSTPSSLKISESPSPAEIVTKPKSLCGAFSSFFSVSSLAAASISDCWITFWLCSSRILSTFIFVSCPYSNAFSNA